MTGSRCETGPPYGRWFFRRFLGDCSCEKISDHRVLFSEKENDWFGVRPGIPIVITDNESGRIAVLSEHHSLISISPFFPPKQRKEELQIRSPDYISEAKILFHLIAFQCPKFER